MWDSSDIPPKKMSTKEKISMFLILFFGLPATAFIIVMGVLQIAEIVKNATLEQTVAGVCVIMAIFWFVICSWAAFIREDT